MPATTAPHSDKHLIYLDSARGIAALMVFIMHFIDRRLHGSQLANYLFFLFNGKDAVSFFFVLSGFVLSYKYIVLRKPLDVRRFYITRIFRLFPAFLVILLLNVLFYYRHVLVAQTFLDVFIYNKCNFWEEAFLVKFHNIYYFAGWTLSVEMLESFLMPFFIVLALKDKRFLGFMLVAFLLQGGNFNFHFLLGIVLSCYYYPLTAPSFRHTRWYRFRPLILAAAVVLFSIRNIHAVSPLGPSFMYLITYLGLDFFFITGLAAFIFLAAILISKNTQAILSHRIFVFFGKISYSIYLVHTLIINIVFASVAYLLPGKSLAVTLTTQMVSYTALTFLAATLLHYSVELPFIRIGRRVAHKVKPSIVVKPEEV